MTANKIVYNKADGVYFDSFVCSLKEESHSYQIKDRFLVPFYHTVINLFWRLPDFCIKCADCVKQATSQLDPKSHFKLTADFIGILQFPVDMTEKFRVQLKVNLKAVLNVFQKNGLNQELLYYCAAGESGKHAETLSNGLIIIYPDFCVFTEEEAKAIALHELKHSLNKDFYKQMALSAAITSVYVCTLATYPLALPVINPILLYCEKRHVQYCERTADDKAMELMGDNAGVKSVVLRQLRRETEKLIVEIEKNHTYSNYTNRENFLALTPQEQLNVCLKVSDLGIRNVNGTSNYTHPTLGDRYHNTLKYKPKKDSHS